MALSYERLKQLYEKNLANGRTEIAAALLREMQRVNPGLGAFRRTDDFYTPSYVAPTGGEGTPVLTRNDVRNLDNATNYGNNTYDYEGATYGEGSPSLVKAPVDFDTQYPMTGNNIKDYPEGYDLSNFDYTKFGYDDLYPMIGKDKFDYPEAYDEGGFDYSKFSMPAPAPQRSWHQKPSGESVRDLFNLIKANNGR